MMQAEQYRLRDLTPGMRASVLFAITPQQMRQFAELSGDLSPIHVDAEFARAKGYAGPVVYGGLLLAKVSQLIGMQLPGEQGVWASVSFDFKKPLYVGQVAELDGRAVNVHPTTGMLELQLVLRSQGRVLGKGKAEVLLGK